MLKFKKQCLQKNVIHTFSKENQNSEDKLVLSISATYNISVLIKGKRTNLDWTRRFLLLCIETQRKCVNIELQKSSET